MYLKEKNYYFFFYNNYLCFKSLYAHDMAICFSAGFSYSVLMWPRFAVVIHRKNNFSDAEIFWLKYIFFAFRAIADFSPLPYSPPPELSFSFFPAKLDRMSELHVCPDIRHAIITCNAPWSGDAAEENKKVWRVNTVLNERISSSFQQRFWYELFIIMYDLSKFPIFPKKLEFSTFSLMCRWFRFAQLAKGKKFRP